MGTYRSALLLAFIFILPSVSLAQPDPTKALIGTWDGQVEATTLSGGNQRTLIINSVKPSADGEWVARGRFGITGQLKDGPGGQEMNVSSKDGEIVIDFVTGNSRSPIRLKLVGENKLEGTVGVTERGRSVDRKASFEKKS
jgi:hypothetical protein